MVGGIAGVGYIEHVVKAPEEGGLLADQGVGEDAEELVGQRVFGDTVVVIESGLSSPADVQGGVDVGLGPLHDLAQLVPIVHVGEVQVLHGGAGDDHTVVFSVTDLIEGGIEGGQVVGIGVLRDVAGGVQQLHLHLEGGVGQLAQQLGLCDDLGGHQVQDQKVQRAHVLVHGPVFRHDEDVFSLQRGPGRQGVWHFNRHGCCLLHIIYIESNCISAYHNCCLSAREFSVDGCTPATDAKIEK